MNESPAISPNPEQTLAQAYTRERARLTALDGRDGAPQGDYARPVFGEGKPCARVLLVGEAPGREEAECGLPFVGKAGRQLNALLERAGIDRAGAYVTNVVKYRPVTRGERTLRNRTPGRQEILQALPLLQIELAALRPHTVVTLGNTPLFALLTLAGEHVQTIGALHGRAMAIKSDSGMRFNLFPLYHPASGIYNQLLVPEMERDILALGEHLVNARERTVFEGTVVI